MSIESRSRQYGNVFGNWQIQELLIKGPDEKTAAFRLSQAEGGARSVLQICNLIAEQGSLNTLPSEDQDRYNQAKQERQNAAEQEVQRMIEKQTDADAPVYLEHTFADWSDETGFGCDMLIRMDLPEEHIGKLYEGQAADGPYQIAKSFLDGLNSLAVPTAQQEDGAAAHTSQEAALSEDSTANAAGKLLGKLPISKLHIMVVAILLLIGIDTYFLLRAATVEKAISGIVEAADTLADAANYEDAILKIEEGLAEYPDSADLKDKLVVYTASLKEQNISSIITEANALASNGDWEAAAEKIEDGLTIYPDSANLQHEQTEYDTLFTQAKSYAISASGQFVQRGDYLSAIELIGQTILVIGEDNDLSDMLQEYKDAFADDAIAEASVLADQEDYAGALNILISAKEEVGSDPNIDANIGVLYEERKQQLESPEVYLDVPDFKQSDPRWAYIHIGSGTIQEQGCFLTSLAMKYSYTTGETVYPNAMMSKLSFLNNSVYWSSVEALGYTRIELYNSYLTNSIMQMIYAQLKAGIPVIIGGQTSAGNTHYVIITGYTGTSAESFSASDFTINDPNQYARVTLAQFISAYPMINWLVY